MRTKGSVSGKVYAGYFLAGGNWCVVTLVFGFCVMAQSAASGGDFFISQWVNMEEISVRTNQIFNVKIVSFYLFKLNSLLIILSIDKCNGRWY